MFSKKDSGWLVWLVAGSPKTLQNQGFPSTQNHKRIQIR